MLPVRIDLNRTGRQNKRALLRRPAPVHDAIFRHRLARVSERGDAKFDALRGPDDGWNRQGSFGKGLAEPRAGDRSVENSVQPQEGHRLARPALRLQIAVFVEQGLLLLVEVAEHRPVDLASEQRLRIEVASSGQRRALQLADRHAILVEHAQLELVDHGALGRARLVHRHAKVARRGRAPPEAVAAAVAGFDAADFAKAFAVVGEMDREDGSIILSPLDEGSERRAHPAEVDRNAFSQGEPHGSVAERRNPVALQHRRRLGRAVEVEFDDLRALLRLRIASPADEAGRDRRKGKNVLSTLAVMRPAKMAPGLIVQRGLKRIRARRMLSPVDFKAGERRGLAEVDLEPRMG